ncbi:MAG: hypothetical protein LBU34_05370 [Planctomycetaceae bacterium]|jgi:hypothetical protein|nr:hypothetical protein [Planctomycetaceae bacterium]
MKLKTKSEQRLEKKIAPREQQLIASKEKAKQKLDQKLQKLGKALHKLQATKSRLKLVERQNRQLSQQFEQEQKNKNSKK